jgi:hypothetical protein
MIMSCHITQRTKLLVHLTTLQQRSVHLLERKTQVFFIAFGVESGRKKTVTSSATQNFNLSILSHQPSTAIKTTII